MTFYAVNCLCHLKPRCQDEEGLGGGIFVMKQEYNLRRPALEGGLYRFYAKGSRFLNRYTVHRFDLKLETGYIYGQLCLRQI